MAENGLPILISADRRIFTDPSLGKQVRQEMTETEFRKFCPNPQTSFPAIADFNQDGVEDNVFGKPKLFIRDGRQGLRLYDIFVEDPFLQPDEVLQEDGISVDSLCVADVNQDKLPDLLWPGHALINQLHSWQIFLNKKTSLPFRDDWSYFSRRLRHYNRKFEVRAHPRLLEEKEPKGNRWRLELQLNHSAFLFSRFPDPTGQTYEPGALLSKEDPEDFLNQRLFSKEWGVFARFGAFIPYTFRVLNNTTPIGFIGGAGVFHQWRYFGLTAEYDYGTAGIFPEKLRTVQSGDSIKELPINEDLPIELNFHNASFTPYFHKAFFGARLHTHLLLGVGPFYERGQAKKRRFAITPTTLQPTGTDDFIVAVDKTKEKYQAGGFRGRVGTHLDVKSFNVGLEILFDFGVPINGDDFQNFDRYLLRGILALSIGFIRPR